METVPTNHAIEGEIGIENVHGSNANSRNVGQDMNRKKDASGNLSSERTRIYVLGGPGSGKGTQCSMVATNFGFLHLSAGDLLEEEVKSGSDIGSMIKDLKMEGKLVPSELVIELLQKAMHKRKDGKFLIDGFTRNEENSTAAEKIMKIEPEFVLLFECKTKTLTKHLLNRNQGRSDDNSVTIQKRLKVFHESTIFHESTTPVVSYYESKGKVQKIDSERSIEEVFEEVKGVFSKRG